MIIVNKYYKGNYLYISQRTKTTIVIFYFFPRALVRRRFTEDSSFNMLNVLHFASLVVV